MENWKDVPKYEGLYQVSDYGNVRSLDRLLVYNNGRTQNRKGSNLKPALSSNYLTVVLMNNAKRQTYGVHVLVAMAFLGHERCGHKLVVDHINENKIDNKLSNLQIITSRSNCSKSTSKKIKGAFEQPNGKWQSAISIKGKSIYLGQFDTQLEASIIYHNTLDQLSK